MAKKSSLSPAKRREVVLLMLRREEPVSVLARRFGVSEPTLHRWRDEFIAGGEAALSGQKPDKAGKQRIIDLEKELEQRDQVIGELTIANRILKKTRDGQN